MPAARISTFASLCVLLALSPLTAAGTQNEIGGKYCGTAFSGGRMVEVETMFETRADGLLSGTYEFADDGGVTSGTLREYSKQSDDTRTLIWIDKYGTGQLVIRFDESRLSFTGNWGIYIDIPAYHWDGQRCETPVV